MIKTGVFASKEETEELFKLAKEAAETPCFGVSSSQVLRGNDFSSMAWRRCEEACHAAALKCGLPEIQGFYGITKDGEFVR